MATTDRIVRGFKTSLVAKVVEVSVNGLIILLLTNVFLTPEEYGLLYLAISILGMAVLFSELGIAKSAARYVTDYRETSPSTVPFIVRRSLTFNAITIAIVASAVVLFREPIVEQFGEPGLVPLLSIGFLFIVARTLHSYGYFVCQGFNRVSWSALLLIVSNVGILASMLVYLGLGLGIVGALLGYITGYLLGATFGLVVLYRWISRIDVHETAREDAEAQRGRERDEHGTDTAADAESADRSLSRRILEYSLPLTITGAASMIYKRVDIILVGAFLTPLAVSYYVLAKQLTEFVTAPASSLGFAVAPTFGESKSSDNIAQASSIYQTTLEHNLLFYIPAAAGIMLVADPAVRYVFGDGYLGAIPVVQVLAVLVLLQSINKITNDALDYLGRARHRAISKGGAAVLNVGLNVLLIPTIGVVGAAIATVISYVIMVAVNIYLIHVELTLSFQRLAGTVTKVCAIALVMSAVVLLFLPSVSGIVSLLATIALGVAVWLALAVTSGLLDLRWAVGQLG